LRPLLLGAILLASAPAFAQPTTTPPPLEGTPPVGPGDIVIQTLYGAGTSLLGGIVGTGVAFARCKQAGGNVTSGEECLDDIAIGAAIGGGLAFALGVYLGGDTETRTGSIGFTLAGGAIGMAVGGGAAYLARDSDGAMIALLIVPPVAGALLGFNLTRRWQQPAMTRVGSLLHVDGNRAALGIPLVIPTGEHTSLSLISGSF